MHQDPSPCSTTKEAGRKWSALPCSKYRLSRWERKAIHMAAQTWLCARRTARSSAEGAVLWQTHFPSTEVSRQRKKANADPRNPTADTAQHPPAGLTGQGNRQDEIHTYGAVYLYLTPMVTRKTPQQLCATYFLGNAVLPGVLVIM